MDHAAGRMPGLVLCAHGTRDAAGADVTRAIERAVTAALPAVDVRLAYVDVQEPSVAALLAGRSSQAPPLVLVPLLLSWGYHVEADIRAAAASHPGVVATRPLGPDPRLAQLLARRLREAGVPVDQPVVLAVAGSSRRRALEDAETTREQLAAIRPGSVALGFAAAHAPSVSDAVQTLRARAGGELAVAAYLLAPGHFLGILRGAGADIVTDPLGSAPEVIDVVLDRYRKGRGLLGRSVDGRA